MTATLTLEQIEKAIAEGLPLAARCRPFESWFTCVPSETPKNRQQYAEWKIDGQLGVYAPYGSYDQCPWAITNAGWVKR